MKKVLLNIVALTSLTFVSFGQTSLDSNTTCEKPMILQEGESYDDFTNKNGVAYYYKTTSKVIITDSENQKFRSNILWSCFQDDSTLLKFEGVGEGNYYGSGFMIKIKKTTSSKLKFKGINILKANDFGFNPEQIILGNSFNINLSDYTTYTESRSSNPSYPPSDLVAPDSNVIDMFYTFDATDTTMAFEMNVDNPSIESALVVTELLLKDFDSYKVGESKRTHVIKNLEIGKTYNLRLEFGLPNAINNQRIAKTNNVSVILKNGAVTGINDVELPISIDLSPNPSKGSFVVSTSQNQKSNIEVFNVLGEMVLQLNDVESGHQIDTELNAGIYLVKANLGNKIVSSRLVIE